MKKEKVEESWGLQPRSRVKVDGKLLEGKVILFKINLNYSGWRHAKVIRYYPGDGGGVRNLIGYQE